MKILPLREASLNDANEHCDASLTAPQCRAPSFVRAPCATPCVRKCCTTGFTVALKAKPRPAGITRKTIRKPATVYIHSDPITITAPGSYLPWLLSGLGLASAVVMGILLFRSGWFDKKKDEDDNKEDKPDDKGNDTGGDDGGHPLTLKNMELEGKDLEVYEVGNAGSLLNGGKKIHDFYDAVKAPFGDTYKQLPVGKYSFVPDGAGPTHAVVTENITILTDGKRVLLVSKDAAPSMEDVKKAFTSSEIASGVAWIRPKNDKVDMRSVLADVLKETVNIDNTPDPHLRCPAGLQPMFMTSGPSKQFEDLQTAYTGLKDNETGVVGDTKITVRIPKAGSLRFVKIKYADEKTPRVAVLEKSESLPENRRLEDGYMGVKVSAMNQELLSLVTQFPELRGSPNIEASVIESCHQLDKDLLGSVALTPEEKNALDHVHKIVSIEAKDGLDALVDDFKRARCYVKNKTHSILPLTDGFVCYRNIKKNTFTIAKDVGDNQHLEFLKSPQTANKRDSRFHIPSGEDRLALFVYRTLHRNGREGAGMVMREPLTNEDWPQMNDLTTAASEQLKNDQALTEENRKIRMMFLTAASKHCQNQMSRYTVSTVIGIMDTAVEHTTDWLEPSTRMTTDQTVNSTEEFGAAAASFLHNKTTGTTPLVMNIKDQTCMIYSALDNLKLVRSYVKGQEKCDYQFVSSETGGSTSVYLYDLAGGFKVDDIKADTRSHIDQVSFTKPKKELFTVDFKSAAKELLNSKGDMVYIIGYGIRMQQTADGQHVRLERSNKDGTLSVVYGKTTKPITESMIEQLAQHATKDVLNLETAKAALVKRVEVAPVPDTESARWNHASGLVKQRPTVTSSRASAKTTPTSKPSKPSSQPATPKPATSKK